MKHLLLCLSLYASSALAQQSAPAPRVPDALERCTQLKAQLQSLRSFPRTEPEKSKREASFQELRKLYAEARKVHVREITRLEGSPTRGFGDVEVHPSHELAVLADCGQGWLFVALPIQTPELEYFEAGYLPTDLALEGPPSCNELTSWLQAAPHRHPLFGAGPRDPLYVIGSAVMVREGPDPSAMVLQKLGYGVEVNAVSRACGDWVLVSTPFGGYGFIHEDFLRATPYDEATLRERQSQAPTLQEQSLWASARAHFFPSDDNRLQAIALQTKVRVLLSPKEQGRCESFVGSCAVLLEDSLYQKKRLDADPKVSQVPVGPWWMLTTATDAAQVAVFRGAYVYTSGECNCCGCETCQTTLNVALEPLGTRERTQFLAASRRPPDSWYRELSREGCAKAEQIARKSPKWDVPRYGGDAKKPATPGAGTCIPGDDGSIWWQQAWHHPELTDVESDEVLRTYRVLEGRVERVGKLTPAHSTAAGTVAWTTRPIVAWRDLDGDGRADEVNPCPFGSYCTQAKGFAR